MIFIDCLISHTTIFKVTSTTNVRRTHSGRVQTDSLRFIDTVVCSDQPERSQNLFVSRIDHDKSFSESHGHAFRLTVNASSDNKELEIILSCGFSEDQRFESLSSMVNISKIVSKRLPIDNNFPISLDHKHFSFSTFSPGPAVKLIRDLFWFFYFFEFIGSFL